MKVRNPSFAVGVDIGGTKISIGIVTQSGLTASTSIPTEAERGFNATIERIFISIEELLKKAKLSQGQLVGIGISCAGPVYPQTGTINNPFTLPGWSNCNIIQPFENKFGVKITLENDADMAMLGEYFCGSGKGANTILMLTFGTGIGGSVIKDGNLWRGTNGEHPEIGHIYVGLEDSNCYCGIKGCFESIASGTGIENLGKPLGFNAAKEVFESAERGNKSALDLLEKVKLAIFRAAWSYIHAFLPETIIIGGGIGEKRYNFYASEIKKAISLATQVPKSKIKIRRAKLGNKSGVVGAGISAIININA